MKISRYQRPNSSPRGVQSPLALPTRLAAYALCAAPLVWNPWGFQGFHGLRVVTATVAVALGLRSLAVRGQVALTPAVLWLLGIAGLFLLGGLVSGDVHTAIFGGTLRDLGLIGWATLIGCVLMGAAAGRDPRGRQQILQVFLVVAALSGVAALVQAAGFRFGSPADFPSGRVTGLFGSAAMLGGFAAFAAPIGFVWALDKARARHERVIGSLAGAGCTATVVLSQARGAWLALTVSVGVVLVGTRQGRRRVVAVLLPVVVLGAAWVGLSGSLLARVSDVFTGDGGTVVGRTVLWEGALEAIADRPLVGWGPDRTRTALPQHLPDDFETRYDDSRLPDRAHNVLLDLALVGGVAAPLLFIGAAVSGGRALRRYPEFDLGVAAGAAGYLVHLMVNFVQVDLDVTVWFVIGLAMSSTPLPEKRLRASVTLGHLLGTAALLAAVVIGALETSADVFLDRAVRAEVSGDYATAEHRYSEAAGLAGFRMIFSEAKGRYVVRRGEGDAVEVASALARRFKGDVTFEALRARATVERAQRTADHELAQEVETQYRSLITRWPSHGELYTGLGIALDVRGLADEAVTAFERAHGIVPRRIEPLQNLALIARREGRLDDAARYAREVLAMDPTDPIMAGLVDDLGLS